MAYASLESASLLSCLYVTPRLSVMKERPASRTFVGAVQTMKSQITAFKRRIRLPLNASRLLIALVEGSVPRLAPAKPAATPPAARP